LIGFPSRGLLPFKFTTGVRITRHPAVRPAPEMAARS
jgi:hypothetical protein